MEGEKHMKIDDLTYEQVIEKAQRDAENLLSTLNVDDEYPDVIEIAHAMGYKVMSAKSNNIVCRSVENDINSRNKDDGKMLIITTVKIHPMTDRVGNLLFNRKVEILYVIARCHLLVNSGAGVDYEFFEPEEKRNSYIMPDTNEEIYAKEFAESILVSKHYLSSWLKELRYRYGKSFPNLAINNIADNYKTSPTFIKKRMQQYGLEY